MKTLRERKLIVSILLPVTGSGCWMSFDKFLNRRESRGERQADAGTLTPRERRQVNRRQNKLSKSNRPTDTASSRKECGRGGIARRPR
jgi:hypothetical protein